MAICIKCNTEIPDGELFCEACSLNPIAGDAGDGQAVLIPQPKGRMQTPREKTKPAPSSEPRKDARHSSHGLRNALVIVCLLLAASVAAMVWQYQQVQLQQAGIVAKEANLQDRERAMAETLERLEELEKKQTELEAIIADRELKIKDLENRLSGSQSSQSQSQYDLTTKQAEIDRLKQEKAELQQQADALQTEIEQLQQDRDTMAAALQEAAVYEEKARFMDSFVVFVENNNTGYYHTYDCGSFPKQSFWAYSRKLAESNGFKPCPDCGGKP